MEAEAGEVGRLGVDEVVGADALVDHGDGADAALELTDHEAQDDVAAQAHAVVHEGAEGAEIGRVTSFHVGDADAVDEVLVVDATPRIDGPALGDGIGVEMAVEEERGSVARTLEPSDGVESAFRHGLELGAEPDPLHAFDHEAGELALFGRAAVALVADHCREKIEGLRGIDPGYELCSVHGLHPSRQGWAISRAATAEDRTRENDRATSEGTRAPDRPPARAARDGARVRRPSRSRSWLRGCVARTLPRRPEARCGPRRPRSGAWAPSRDAGAS